MKKKLITLSLCLELGFECENLTFKLMSKAWGEGEEGIPTEQLAGCGVCAMAESGRLIQKASIRY